MNQLSRTYNLIKTNKPKIKDATIKKYSLTLNKLFDIIGVEVSMWTSNPADVFKHYSVIEDAITEINELKNPNTQNNYYNSIMSILEDGEVKDYYRKQREQTTLRIIERQLTKTPNLPNVEVVLKFMDILAEKSHYALELICRLIYRYSFRNEVGSLRMISLSDYSKLKTDDKDNYLIIDDYDDGIKYTISRSIYKTSKTYETIITEVDSLEIIEKLNNYIYSHNNTKGNVLFPQKRSNEPLTSNNISEQIQRWSLKYVDTKITSNIIFKVSVSHLREQLTDLEEKSYNRGTSIETIAKYYTK